MLITTDPVWFAPINVLYHFARLDDVSSEKHKKTKVFRKAYEANLAAIMLMGVIKSQRVQYWMQVVPDKQESPDVRTFRYSNDPAKKNWQDIQEVEVTQYEKHSPESITDFLKRTKLAYPYPAQTTILCLADKTTTLPSWKQMYTDLKGLSPHTPVIILAKTHPSKTIYTICQIHPEIDLLTDFDIMEESYNKKYLGVLKVKLDAHNRLQFI